MKRREAVEYAPERRITPPRVLASLLVLTWIVIAFRIGGLPLAIRAAFIFTVPLSLIWLTDLMTKFAGIALKKSLQPDFEMNSFALRLVAWILIIGIPAAWFAFSRI